MSAFYAVRRRGAYGRDALHGTYRDPETAERVAAGLRAGRYPSAHVERIELPANVVPMFTVVGSRLVVEDTTW